MIIYTGCLALGLFFTIISAFLGHFFGGGHEGGDLGTGGHAEAGLDTHGMPGISFFSPTVLASFITAFGAFGIVFSHIEITKNVWASAPLSAVSGGIVAGLVFLLFNSMFKKTQSSSESQVASLPGQTASIITPIPQDGVGEIAYVQGGTRYTAPARTENGTPIAGGKSVRISRVIGTQFYVEPFN
ncbi:MAG TPA: NfeD family protein [Verrucomicrobiae bacterium]|nr:NfeD family protein [Verrucomicrobiae bacterium]